MRLDIEGSKVTIYKDDGSTYTQELPDRIGIFQRLVLQIIEDLCNSSGGGANVEKWALKDYPDELIPFDKVNELGSAAKLDAGTNVGDVPVINESGTIDMGNSNWQNIDDGSDDIVIYGGEA